MRPTLTDGEEKRWTVFVGGVEVNDYLHNFDDAIRLAEEYIDDDYDDVVLYQYDTSEEVRLT
jgi:hypothetical protein